MNAHLTCSLSLAVCALSASAEALWLRPNPTASWGDPANWLTGVDTPVNRLPNTNDVVSCNSRLTSTEGGQPLAVTAGTAAECLRLTMHDSLTYRITNIWLSVGAGASLTCTDPNSLDEGGASLQVGVLDRALLTLDGGAVTSRYVMVGRGAGGSGVVSNNAGTWNAEYTASGAEGTGLIVNAGAFLSTYVVIGRRAGSVGRIRHENGTFNVLTQFVVGSAGHGAFDASARFVASSFSMGTAGGSGEVVIEEGGEGAVSGQCNIGGRDGTSTGSGILWLKGGALTFTDGVLNEKLFVRRDAGASGQLRGWGTVSGNAPDAGTVRMVLNGTVVADGGDAERDLDLHRVVSVTNRFGNADGTNGWYAVGKGRVLFPRTWFSDANVTRCLGDWPYEPVPGLVNSVRATFSGVPGNNSFFRGALYAPDRTDIPAGLSAGERPLGVWRLGLYSHLHNPALLSFSTAALTFRYDQTQVKDHDKLKLYRYENGAWALKRTAFPDGSGLISTDGPLPRLTSGDPNIGWFALTAREMNGTLFSIR